MRDGMAGTGPGPGPSPSGQQGNRVPWRARRVIVMVAAALALWAGWATAAGAEATPAPSGAAVQLEGAEPAPREWVREAPPSVRLRFSAPVLLDGSRVRLSSYRREDVPGHLTQPAAAELLFTPAEPLEEATYEVMWTVRTPSGHTASGRYGFTYAVPKPEWDEPLDRRDINRALGNLVPGWLLIIPAVAGAGGLLWIVWNVWRS